MRQKFKKFLHKAKTLLGWKTSVPEIVVSGLEKEEKMFKQSVEEECERILERARSHLHEIEGISVHVKTSHKPTSQLYEVQGTLHMPGLDFHARAASRELYLAINQLAQELDKEARKQKSMKDADGRRRGK